MIAELLNNLNQNGIAYIILCAFSAWLGKIWAGRIARREDATLQGQLELLKGEIESTQKKLAGTVEKAVHVHKVQFEKEFGVYQDLMKEANRLHLAFFTLHPSLKPIFDTQPEAECYYNPLREDLFSSVEAVRTTIRVNRPFYAENVFQCCENLLDLAIEEATSLKTAPGTGSLSFKEIEQMKKDIQGVFDNLTDSIRNRLNSIVVIE